MSTFILVPGAWLGAWAWQPVARSLRGAAHEVYPMSLTGLADRVHLAGPEVNLETHIADIVNLIVYEDLRDVVLVGHSYVRHRRHRRLGSDPRADRERGLCRFGTRA